ncbi:MAG: hypothetical protein IPJ76_11085 [Flavobacteriales bacterium]|nr:MAG: hypothetical protein IPJ76_11085 [Flavobacteriales bacterium]
MSIGARQTSVALMLLLAASTTSAQATNTSYRQKPGTVNEQVVDFAQERMGKKVGRGECWDLAAEALNNAGATWDGSYGWGVVLDPGKDSILPGDIIQFKDVELEWEEGNSRNRMTMPHHTAVVMEVKAPGVFIIAHQNFGPIGRKVGTTELVMAHVKKGRATFYRPQG